ncbi:methyl-accepting chemotaxis protein, partial [Cellulomonas sp.]|uniref:methyl-accepting chemotaxis protein n=1 Tax=Cellulomonas sp. TaxID=40001 RepID=UPI001B2D0E7C
MSKSRLTTRLSVRAKVLGIVAAGIVVSIAIGLLAMSSAARLRATTAEMAQEQTSVSSSLAGLKDSVWAMRNAVSVIGIYVGGDVESKITAYGDASAALDAAMADLADHYSGSGEALPSGFDDFQASLDEYRAGVEQKLVVAARAGDREGYQAQRERLATVGGKMLADLDAIDERVAADLTTLTRAADASAIRELVLIAIALGVGVVVLVVLGLWLARSLRRSVAALQVAVDALARGDLTVRAEVRSSDELGQMAASLNTAQEAVGATLSGVVRAAAAVAVSSESLSAASSQVASGSEETSVQAGVVAAAAEQVSRSVQSVAAGAEQMSASIREIAQNATEAAKVAQNATDAASSANDSVARLGSSSQEIGNVVKLITSIAEQTNLLALN